MSQDEECSKDVIPFPFEPDRGLLAQQDESGEKCLSASLDSRLAELEAMRLLLAILPPLGEDGVIRVIDWIEEVLGLRREHRRGGTGDVPSPRDADHAVETPKAFIAAKKPQTAVELIACLAYYLSEHRSLEHFRTSDIVALNTEAACPKFGNASRDVADADRRNG